MRPLRFILIICALAAASPARADDVAGTWLLDESTAPFKSGSLAIADAPDGLRFEGKLSGASDVAIAATVAKTGPWKIEVPHSAGIDGVLAGAATPASDVYAFKLSGAFLLASWTAQGQAGGAVFHREKDGARGKIVIDPLPAGATEERTPPFVDAHGILRGQSSIKNAQGSVVTVHRADGAVTQVVFSAGNRQLSILEEGELAVIDWVFDKVSFNHARFFGFPGPGPTRVAFDESGNLAIGFANGDRMVRDGKTLDLVSGDFTETKNHETYQNGARSLPSIHYAGNRAVIQVVWWEYPPSGGVFDLLVGKTVVGSLPASALYQKVSTGGGGYDVNRRFGDLRAALRSALAAKTDPGTKKFLAAIGP